MSKWQLLFLTYSNFKVTLVKPNSTIKEINEPNCGPNKPNKETNELNYELNNTNHQLKESRTIYTSLTKKELLIINLLENHVHITQKQLSLETGLSVSSIKRIQKN